MADRLYLWIRDRRAETEVLRTYADDRVAGIISRLLDSLEEVLSEQESELVNLTQASELCGYSTDQLRRLIRTGKLTDYGRHGAPRVRPSELPRRAGPLPTKAHPLQLAGAERQQTARSIVNSIQ